MNTAQLIVGLATMKVSGHLSNHAFDTMCRFWAKSALPGQNYCPPSWHLVKKIIGVPDPNDYKWA